MLFDPYLWLAFRPMHIDHLAIWTADLEKMKDFYVKYFEMTAGARYHNPAKNFTSYFLSCSGSSMRLELMHRPDRAGAAQRGMCTGLTHLAIAVGSKAEVDTRTEQLRDDGYTIQSEPRRTGDGYYESVVLDPEGNWIELTE